MGVPRLWRWTTNAQASAVRYAADCTDLAHWLQASVGIKEPATIDALVIDLNAVIHNANGTPFGGLRFTQDEGFSEDLFDAAFSLRPGQLAAAVKAQSEDSKEADAAEFSWNVPPEAMTAHQLVVAAVAESGCPASDLRLTLFLQRALLRLIAIIWAMGPRNALFVALDGPAPAAKFTQQRERRYRASYGMVSAASKGGEHIAAFPPGFGPHETVQGASAVPGKLYDPSAISPGTALMCRIDAAVRKLLDSLVASVSADGRSSGTHLASRALTRAGLRARGAVDESKRPILLESTCNVVFSGAGVAGEGEHKLMSLLRAWLSGGQPSVVAECSRWDTAGGCIGRSCGDESGMYWWEQPGRASATGATTSSDTASSDTASSDTAAAASAGGTRDERPEDATVVFWGPDGDALILGICLLGRFGSEDGRIGREHQTPPLREVLIARDFDAVFRRQWKTQIRHDKSQAKAKAHGPAATTGILAAPGYHHHKGQAAPELLTTPKAEPEAESGAGTPVVQAEHAESDVSESDDASERSDTADHTDHAEAVGAASGSVKVAESRPWSKKGKGGDRKGRRGVGQTAKGKKRPLGAFISSRLLAHSVFEVREHSGKKKAGKRRAKKGGKQETKGGKHRKEHTDDDDHDNDNDASTTHTSEHDEATTTPVWALNSQQSRRCVDLSAIMCVMGNDFLPRPEALDLDGRGMDRLFTAYRSAEAEYEWAIKQEAEEVKAGDAEGDDAVSAAAAIARASGVATDSNFPDGCGGLAWSPLVSVGGSGVSGTVCGSAEVGAKWLCRLLWEAAHEFERSDLSSITDGISAAGSKFHGLPGSANGASATGRRASLTMEGGSDDDDDYSHSGASSVGGSSAKSSAFDLSEYVGAGGVMGEFKMRSVQSAQSGSAGARGSDPPYVGDSASLAVVDVIRATWQTLSGPYSGGVEPDSAFDGWSRGEWYQQHMSGCGPLHHVRSIASGSGGEAASGKRGYGPYPAAGGEGLIDDSSHTDQDPGERLAETAAADVMAVACEAWLAGVAFVCSYYLVGLPSWGYRYPFAHSPMLTDAAAWAVSDGGLYGVRDAGISPAEDITATPTDATDHDHDRDDDDGKDASLPQDPADTPIMCAKRLAEVWTGADGYEVPVIRLCVPIGKPLSAAAHGIAVITPYSLHLLPSSLQKAMRIMLPWAPQTSASALVAASGAKSHVADTAPTATGFMSSAELPAELLEKAQLAVGTSESSQAWWFPAWDDIRQDSEKAHAEWQVKLWVPMVAMGWALGCANWWEEAATSASAIPALLLENDTHGLPAETNVWARKPATTD